MHIDSPAYQICDASLCHFPFLFLPSHGTTWPLGDVCVDGSPPLMADDANDNDTQTSQVCGTTSWTD